MAEESIQKEMGSVTPASFMPDGELDLKSSGKLVTTALSPPLILKSEEKVQSRYLSPRISSCHDFCKYGKKHGSEAEEKRLSFRKFLKEKKKLAQDVEKDQVTVLLPRAKSLNRGHEKNSKRTEDETHLQSKPSPINRADILKTKTKSSIEKFDSSVVNKMIKQKVSPSVTEPKKIKRKLPLPPEKVDVVVKPAITSKTKAPLIRSISQKSSQSLISRLSKEKKEMRSIEIIKIGERKFLRSFSSNTPLENGSSLQPRKLRCIKKITTPHENVSGLPPIKLRSIKKMSAPREKNSSFRPRQLRSAKDASNIDLDTEPKNEESDSATDEASDEEIEGDDKNEVSENEEKKKQRRHAATKSEDNTSTPFKLKFKRGKVLNLRSDSIGARRLWFNVGWSPNENPNNNGALVRKSFRKKREVSNLVSEAANSEVENVVLKHQGVAEKKDAQSLFNHVIEETASKLVETRKSKVKALVGAFETVISLQ